MNDIDPNRLYSEKEIAALFRKASELQNANSATPPAGLSLAEIRKIASDLGIESQYLEAAAADLQAPTAGGRSWLGGPTTLESARIVRGVSSEDAFEEMVEECRRVFGQTGRTEQRGSTIEWMSNGPQLEEVRLTVTPRGEATRLRLLQNYDGAAGLFYFAGGGISLIAVFSTIAAVDLPMLVEIVIAGGGLGSFAALLRGLFGRFIRNRRKTQNTLMARLESLAAGPEAERQNAPETAGTQTILQIPDPSIYTNEERTPAERGGRKENICSCQFGERFHHGWSGSLH